jgi:hypothetical protein
MLLCGGKWRPTALYLATTNFLLSTNSTPLFRIAIYTPGGMEDFTFIMEILFYKHLFLMKTFLPLQPEFKG